MERIEHALKNRRSLKAVKRKLGTGKNHMYALRERQGSFTTNMYKVVKAAMIFYRDQPGQQW